MTLSEDLKKPLNIVFLLLAIAGIGLSVIFYFDGRKTKGISYQINEPSSLIYDSHNSSSAIKVIEKDSTPIKDNVYILTGVIWNNGDLPISNEDIRQTIDLNLMSAKKILDFKIVKQTDPTIANFRLSRKDNKKLGVSWKYFDPGYGFKFQVIYTGGDNPNFGLTGKVLDVQHFKRTNFNKSPSIPVYALLFLGYIIMLLPNPIIVKKITTDSLFNRYMVTYDKIFAYLFTVRVVLFLLCILSFYLLTSNGSIPFTN